MFNPMALFSGLSTPHLVGLEPVLDDVGLVVGDGHAVAHTQHLQQIQEPEVLQPEAKPG